MYAFGRDRSSRLWRTAVPTAASSTSAPCQLQLPTATSSTSASRQLRRSATDSVRHDSEHLPPAEFQREVAVDVPPNFVAKPRRRQEPALEPPEKKRKSRLPRLKIRFSRKKRSAHIEWPEGIDEKLKGSTMKDSEAPPATVAECRSERSSRTYRVYPEFITDDTLDYSRVYGNGSSRASRAASTWEMNNVGYTTGACAAIPSEVRTTPVRCGSMRTSVRRYRQQTLTPPKCGNISSRAESCPNVSSTADALTQRQFVDLRRSDSVREDTCDGPPTLNTPQHVKCSAERTFGTEIAFHRPVVGEIKRYWLIRAEEERLGTYNVQDTTMSFEELPRTIQPFVLYHKPLVEEVKNYWRKRRKELRRNYCPRDMMENYHDGSSVSPGPAGDNAMEAVGDYWGTSKSYQSSPEDIESDLTDLGRMTLDHILPHPTASRPAPPRTRRTAAKPEPASFDSQSQQTSTATPNSQNIGTSQIADCRKEEHPDTTKPEPSDIDDPDGRRRLNIEYSARAGDVIDTRTESLDTADTGGNVEYDSQIVDTISTSCGSNKKQQKQDSFTQTSDSEPESSEEEDQPSPVAPRKTNNRFGFRISRKESFVQANSFWKSLQDVRETNAANKLQQKHSDRGEIPKKHHPVSVFFRNLIAKTEQDAAVAMPNVNCRRQPLSPRSSLDDQYLRDDQDRRTSAVARVRPQILDKENVSERPTALVTGKRAGGGQMSAVLQQLQAEQRPVQLVAPYHLQRQADGSCSTRRHIKPGVVQQLRAQFEHLATRNH